MDTIRHWDTGWLAHVFNQTYRHGEDSVINDVEYLAALGWTSGKPCSARELWRDIAGRIEFESAELRRTATQIIDSGSLSTRILRALGGPVAGSEPGRDELTRVYRELCVCLAENRMFGV
jgi:hypothetical protein